MHNVNDVIELLNDEVLCQYLQELRKAKELRDVIELNGMITNSIQSIEFDIRNHWNSLIGEKE